MCLLTENIHWLWFAEWTGQCGTSQTQGATANPQRQARLGFSQKAEMHVKMWAKKKKEVGSHCLSEQAITASHWVRAADAYPATVRSAVWVLRLAWSGPWLEDYGWKGPSGHCRMHEEEKKLNENERWLLNIISQEVFELCSEVTNLKRCLAIVERSTVTLEEGRRTGSSIRVDMIGSKNSSGASA